MHVQIKTLKMQNKGLPQILISFLNYLTVIKGYSPRTVTEYKLDLIMLFRFLKIYKNLVDDNINFQEVKIDDIDSEFIRNINLNDLYNFVEFLKDKKNSATTRRRKVTTIKSFFKYLHTKEKIIESNIAIDLEKPKLKKRLPIYLTLEESRKLLGVIDGRYGARDYCIITLFLNCALRISELRSIQLSNIKNDTLTIVGKGDKERTIYLNEACIQAIDSYIIERNKYLNKIKDKDILFISKNFGTMSVRGIEKMVKKYVGKAGLDTNKYTPHKLRHTSATLMYKYGGVDIRSLQEILGHESVATTQVYTHVDSDLLRAAVKSNPLNSGKSK